jgi:hypothetical protein
MLTSSALAGMNLQGSPFEVHELANNCSRIMVWAVDLDDLNGTSIKSLGSGLTRPPQMVVQSSMNDGVPDWT